MRHSPETTPAKRIRLSPETIAQARQMYADGVPVREICAQLGISPGALSFWVDGGPASGPLHLEPLPRRRGGTAPIRRRRRLKGDRVALVARLWRTAEAQVRDIEDRLLRDAQPPDERERDARTLAVLVKTLRELSALDEAGAPPEAEDDDDGPRDIDEFRRDLARRMDAFVAERLRAAIPGDGEAP
jgi:hypothetical protein